MVLAPWRICAAFALTLLAAHDSAGAQGNMAGQRSTPSRVWASISVNAPLFRPGQDVNVAFATVNLTEAPIAATRLRDDTVLIINGKEWEQSRFSFSNGLHDGREFIPPGKATSFTYQLTRLFTAAGVYRVVWKGPDFETLPIEFRVMDNWF